MKSTPESAPPLHPLSSHDVPLSRDASVENATFPNPPHGALVTPYDEAAAKALAEAREMLAKDKAELVVLLQKKARLPTIKFKMRSIKERIGEAEARIESLSYSRSTMADQEDVGTPVPEAASSTCRPPSTPSDVEELPVVNEVSSTKIGAENVCAQVIQVHPSHPFGSDPEPTVQADRLVLANTDEPSNKHEEDATAEKERESKKRKLTLEELRTELEGLGQKKRPTLDQQARMKEIRAVVNVNEVRLTVHYPVREFLWRDND